MRRQRHADSFDEPKRTNRKSRRYRENTVPEKCDKKSPKINHIYPKNDSQYKYFQAIDKYDITFGIGVAGTGKTIISVYKALINLLEGNVERIILSRAAVEAGERIGFLPGGIKEKLLPYMIPLYDCLNQTLPKQIIEGYIKQGKIEIAPVAFLRGRTFSNTFIVADECQNMTTAQMKMLLTRFGEGSKMVLTGDITQSDLPFSVQSGLSHAVDKLSKVPEIAFCNFSCQDVVRHPIVSKIITAYEE